MARFGKTSRKRLDECHADLRRLFSAVVLAYNCTVLVGHRGKEEQNKAFETGKSLCRFPNSKHNKKPSDAVDVAPWFDEKPHVRWDDTEKFYEFMGFVQGIAYMLNIDIRVGGNWDGDQDLHDQKLMDLVHFELVR